jgi:hypothetical protein
MGMIEEARVNLAKGKRGDSNALLIANVQASIAIAESLDGVHELLAALLDGKD